MQFILRFQSATLSYGFIKVKEKSFLFSTAKVKYSGHLADHFGLLLKSDSDATQCNVLAFDKDTEGGNFSIFRWRWIRSGKLPAPISAFRGLQAQTTRGMRKPFPYKDGDVIDIKVAIDQDMIEIFAGEKIAFTYRYYGHTEYQIGLMAQDGCAEFFDIRVTE